MTTVCHLTPRQLDVTKLLWQGMTNREIAALLFISPKTVDSYISVIFSRTNSKRRTELVSKLAKNEIEIICDYRDGRKKRRIIVLSMSKMHKKQDPPPKLVIGLFCPRCGSENTSFHWDEHNKSYSYKCNSCRHLFSQLSSSDETFW